MSNPENRKSVQKFFSPLERRFQEEEEQLVAREQELQKQHGEEVAGSDKSLPTRNQHSYAGEEAAKKKNFDEKIYLFPESYNALRRELQEHWTTFFERVNPHTGTSLAFDMVFNAAQFIGIMNGALGKHLQFDSDDIDQTCQVFLDELRMKRGLSPLH